MTTSRHPSALIPLAVITSMLAFAAEARAVVINFDSAADYTGNFTETANAASLSWNAGGYLEEFHASTATASIARYNNPISSASYSLSLDASFTYNMQSYAGASAGFMTHLSGTETTSTGYMSVFRLTTTGADFRIFEGTAMSGGAGTLLTTLNFSGAFSTNTYYTFHLDVENTGSSLIFTGSILNASTGTVIATFNPFTDLTPSSISSSLVGIRLGTVNGTYTRADNFAVSAIPEPSAFAAFGGLAALGLALQRRRRRA